MLVKGVVRLNLVSFVGSRFGDEEMAGRNGWLNCREKNGAELFCFVFFLEKQTHTHKQLALINGGKILILLLFLKIGSFNYLNLYSFLKKTKTNKQTYIYIL